MPLLATNLTLSAFMTGLVWFVQVVHYPLMIEVHEPGFRGYKNEHVRKTFWVVGPIMLAEMMAAVLLVIHRPTQVQAAIAWTLLGLLVLIWVSTFLLQGPEHRRLLNGFSKTAHQRLVQTNWLRTVLWSVRTGILLAVTAL